MKPALYKLCKSRDRTMNFWTVIPKHWCRGDPSPPICIREEVCFTRTFLISLDLAEYTTREITRDVSSNYLSALITINSCGPAKAGTTSPGGIPQGQQESN
ncbi:hypothetical protein PoB_003589400 [Plakobranchus ocellatus]|uniref:Uncharacterized protein n=1 Tax=Plakobranchus ocellatus TaxID=259542 RepID=A0AAV4ATD9_9GAST|nr:hypothetical protein PoB_003589400 [Plakobranchus ocellatus]